MFIKLIFITLLALCQIYAEKAPDEALIALINSPKPNEIIADKNTSSLLSLIKPSESDPWEIIDVKTLAVNTSQNRNGDILEYSALILYSYKSRLVNYTMERGMVCTWIYFDGKAVLSAYSVLGFKGSSNFLELRSEDKPKDITP